MARRAAKRTPSTTPRARPASRDRGPGATASSGGDLDLEDVLGDLGRLLDTPLDQLVDGDLERAMLAQITREATDAPAIVTLRKVVAFVGAGRPATQAGRLKSADALALAEHLGLDTQRPASIRSMDDLAETARLVHWAIASELLEVKGSRLVAGSRARYVEHDPLSACLAVTATLLEAGLLLGFRQGWHKRYAELLDAGAPSLLEAIAEQGGTVPLAEIQQTGWQLVAAEFGYDVRDAAERAHAVALVAALVAELVELGILRRESGSVTLTALGQTFAVVVSLFDEDDDDDEDEDEDLTP
ncbi:MAG: hypothetical protein ACYCXY_13275 [Acidimicrobiales bacterium]